VSRAEPAGARPAGEASALQVLDRTFAVLDLFTVERPEWTTTEVARATGLPIPTAHRILVTLRRHRFVARDEATKRFHLGPAALELGERARVAAEAGHGMAADSGPSPGPPAPAAVAASPAGRDV
jgi:hypothetical protein